MRRVSERFNSLHLTAFPLGVFFLFQSNFLETSDRMMVLSRGTVAPFHFELFKTQKTMALFLFRRLNGIRT